MGLDISYGRSLVKAKGNEAFDGAGELLEDQDWEQLFVNPDFDVAEEIQHGHAYKYEDGGYFRAGSYSGYGRWRRDLAVLAGYDNAEAVWSNPVAGPFVEMINFSDCEGTIGASVSKKLAKDFSDHQAKVDAMDDGYFQEKYAEWRKAFEVASDNGFVEFG